MPDFSESPDWFIVRGVPILDEHSLPMGNDGKSLKFDRNKLAEIAAHNQRRIDDTGDATPIVIGHTPRKAPDGRRTEQVPVVGFAKNYRVGTIGKLNPRAAILVDKYFPKSKADEIRQYPRRSIEYWASDGTIDPISILGGETPMRDLGLMTYSRDSSRGSEAPVMFSHGVEQPFRFAHDSPSEGDVIDDMEVVEDSTPASTPGLFDTDATQSTDDTSNASNEDNGMFDQQMLQDVVTHIMTNIPAFKWVNEQYEQALQAQAAQAAQPAIDAMQPTPGAPIDDPTAPPKPPMPPGAPGQQPGQPPEQPPMAANGSMPPGVGEPNGNGNGPPPPNGQPSTGDAAVNSEDEAYELANVKMSRDQLRNEVAALKEQNEKLQRERDEVSRKYTRAQRETMLSDLQAEGYKFDRGAVLKSMEYMDAKQAREFIDNVVKYSRRGPAGNVLRTPPISDSGDDPSNRPMNEREFEEAKQYQREHPDKPWEACIRYGKGLVPA